MFDGSSIEGFVRIEESDMVLKPDLETFRVLPNGRCRGQSRASDLRYLQPRRLVVRRLHAPGAEAADRASQVDGLRDDGRRGGGVLHFPARTRDGQPTTITHDHGGYFDQTPVDRAEEIRRLIVQDLVRRWGSRWRPGTTRSRRGSTKSISATRKRLETADNLATFRFVVRNVAYRHGFLATFMPKPIFGQNGSGMHTHQSLFRKGSNAFHDPKAQWELSDVALAYIAGLLTHARGFCAVTNPLVEQLQAARAGLRGARTTWRGRCATARRWSAFPTAAASATRCELRMPDPSAEPVPRARGAARGRAGRRRAAS